MKVKLTPDLKKFVDLELKTGRFESSDEMIRVALRMLRERETEIEAVRTAIDESREQLRRGEGISALQMTVERIRAGAIRKFGHPRKRKAS